MSVVQNFVLEASMKYVCFICAVATMLVPAAAGPTQKTVEEKNLTIISAEASADGRSAIAKEIIEECIVSLPAVADLEPLVEAKSKYLRHINGKENNNKYVKTYTAKVEIHYLIRQKEMIIITTNSVPAQKPVIKEIERMVRKVETVISDPQEGDLFADRSPREYYFTSGQKAAQNAKARAEVWLKQHRGVVCPPKQETSQ